VQGDARGREQLLELATAGGASVALAPLNGADFSAGWQWLGAEPGGRTVLALRRSAEGPPSVARLSAGGAPTTAYDGGAKAAWDRGLKVAELQLGAGAAMFPAWLWRNPGVALRGLVVSVHGGPRLVARPYWDAGVAWLATQGFAVIEPNYRASDGYGVAFANATVESEVQDVVATVAAARGGTGGLADGLPVMLLAHSYGASLVRLAWPRLSGVERVVLVSPVGFTGAWPGSPPRRLVVFHGTRDPIAPASAVRDGFRDATGDFVGTAWARRYEIPGEGHFFHRPASWMGVFEALAAP
jgi:hypothetical protein